MPQSGIPIPNLFPSSLTDCCISSIIGNLKKCGQKVEIHSKRLTGDLETQYDLNFIQTKYFYESVATAREFITSFLASNVIDALAERLFVSRDEGSIFCFSVLCNDRLSKLSVVHHEEDEDDKAKSFWSLPQSNCLLLECFYQLRFLSYLTIQDVCTNDLLLAVAETCSKLQVLDISFSDQVTDMGLVYLCGVSVTNSTGPLDHYYPFRVRGCKYLRELYFLPKTGSGKIMPSVISYILRHLTFLQVADLENLQEGIEYYYKGGSDGQYRPRPGRLNPLQLRYYTGSDDKLSSVIPICPKLTNFRLSVTDSLPDLANVLKTSTNSLEKVALVFNVQQVLEEENQGARSEPILPGLGTFLCCCGNRISSLEIDFYPESSKSIGFQTLKMISEQCLLLESLTFNGFQTNENDPILATPLKFNFLTSLKMSDINVDQNGREMFRFLLGGCPELENLNLAFRTTTYFFNDFLLDDILLLNSFGRLEHFSLSKVSLTLISALRMISSRPKLRSLGHLLMWDVEISELDAFAQILRRAKSFNLLQDISIT